MKPSRFPQQTIELQPPAGMTEAECGTLAVHQTGVQCISRWVPSWRDRLRIALGGPIWLWVWSGRTQPPVALDTESPFVGGGSPLAEAERRHVKSEAALNGLVSELGRKLGALVLLAALLVLPGCASMGGPRHVTVVSLAGTAGVLDTFVRSEAALVCGQPTAPQAPLCVPVPRHLQIVDMADRAAALGEAASLAMARLPQGSPQPAEVVTMLAQVNGLVLAAMRLVPESHQKQAIAQAIGFEGVK